GLIEDYEALRSLPIQRLSAVETSGPGELIFIAQALYLSGLATAKPAALVVSEAIWPQVSALNLGYPVLRSHDAMLAFAKASAHFQVEPKPTGSRHPTAYVDPTATVHGTAALGPYAVVEEGAEIGPRAILHAGVKIGRGSKVGADSVLFAGVVVYHDVVIGERVRIHGNSVIGADGFGYVQERTPTGLRHVKIHHVGGVEIHDDVEIGASSTVDRGTLGNTVLGKNTILDNQVQVGHNAITEQGVVMCGGSGLAGSSYVEKFAFIGGYAAISNKVRVGTGALIAAMSCVSTSVPAGRRWGGNPAMDRMQFNKSWALIGRLPEIFAYVKAERKKQDGSS
ncbi:MAG: UDP-3-O-(3-hydroxymyristoyl)glucosamine N-acyltransferase, partial [Proteobacteria bacterium]